jgi:hypothetical protein
MTSRGIAPICKLTRPGLQMRSLCFRLANTRLPRYLALMRMLLLPVLWIGLSLGAAELSFDFNETRAGEPPAGFRSAVVGKGKPGTWQVVLDEVAPALAPLTSKAPAVARRAVLAQLAQDPTDEHFPILIYEGETFGDFSLTTRVKMVKGVMEQMAGIAFRMLNESNFYVVRASALGNTFRFYKVLNGERGPLVGPEIPVAADTWHDLKVECKGNEIRCSLDGKELVNVTDKANPLASGRIAFWTKSDSVSYFADAKVSYTRLEPPAQALVRKFSKKYPRLLGIEVYVAGAEEKTTRLVAGPDEKALGKPGGAAEYDVIANGNKYYGKEKGKVNVMLPLRDRNGEIIAAVRVTMNSFTGQTEANAVTRATPIVKEMQGEVQSLSDLVENLGAAK